MLTKKVKQHAVPLRPLFDSPTMMMMTIMAMVMMMMTMMMMVLGLIQAYLGFASTKTSNV